MIFATFSVKPNLPQNRLQLGFTVSINSKTILNLFVFNFYLIKIAFTHISYF